MSNDGVGIQRGGGDTVVLRVFGDNNLLKILVGASGFEPPTSWSRTRRSSQAEPRPDPIQCRLPDGWGQLVLSFEIAALSK